MRCLGLVAALTIGSTVIAAEPSPRKAVIEFGWDEPDTAFLRTQVAQLERSPFDGCVFHVNAQDHAGKPISLTWEGWGKRRFADDVVKASRDDLRGFRPKRFTRNFLRFNMTPADVDWFDDFDPILANLKLAANLARDGRCAGILLDTEQYQGKLFSFRARPASKTNGWNAYADQARRRGRDAMTALQDGFPDLAVLLTFGPSLTWEQSQGGKIALETVDYGLLAPFVGGMVEAAKGKTKIIDGYEQSYGFKKSSQFQASYRSMQASFDDLARIDGVRREVLSAGFGLWLDFDWRSKGWNASDPSKNHFTPETFEIATRAALERADEYVWIYTETPRWWTAAGTTEKLPDAYVAALKRARNGIRSDTD